MNDNEIKRILASARFKFRSDALVNWKINNPILLAGEAGVVTGLNTVGDGLEDKTQKIKFGDGIHDWNNLDWWYGPQGEDEGSNITVDQTYNPESQNAQSGFAVAEAVSIKMDKFGEVYDEGRNINLNQEDQTAFHGYEIALHAYKRLLLIGETVTLNNNKLSDVGNPINNTDAANKQYVDGLVGDISTALDELHTYAQALVNGGATE